MVSGETVDDVHVLPERVLILLRDERRTDTAARGADALDVTARQEEVMRRRLARHRQPALLRRPDHRDLQKIKMFKSDESDDRDTCSSPHQVVEVVGGGRHSTSSLRATWQMWTGRW